MRYPWPLLLLFACSQPATLQSDTALPRHSTGLELQAYPAGGVVALHHQNRLNDTDVLTMRIGWNQTERGDFGEHHDESGGGPGIGIGWRRYQQAGAPGWYWGGRVDLWNLDIDWRDQNPSRSGNTTVDVLQPTAEGGYRYPLGDGWLLDLGLALGIEINTLTNGEDVGEGAILLLGVSFLRAHP